MLRIEANLGDYRGYLILFVDEVDHVRRDRDTFLVRRLPQRIQAKLILVFVSNRLNWPDHLGARVKSFLKLNELIFEPYDAYRQFCQRAALPAMTGRAFGDLAAELHLP